METWSLDILRQGGWDLWVAVCVAACIVLVIGALMRGGRDPWSLTLATVGVLGTVAVLTLRFLPTPLVGMIWTFLILALVCVEFYRRLLEPLGPARTAGLMGLRLIAIALLVPMLFEPVIRFVSRPKPQRPLLVLIDTSGSMSVPDVQNGPTRLESVVRMLLPKTGLLADHFVPTYFRFDATTRKLDSTAALPALVADGPATDLVGAVATALASTDREDASVLLISDGIDNVSPNVLSAIRASRRPVHTVAVGSENAAPTSLINVAIRDVSIPDELSVGTQTLVKATIESSALNDRVIDVKLAEIDESGRPIAMEISRKLVLQSGRPQTVELPFTPTRTGRQRLAVWVDPVPGERSLADNRQEVQALALQSRIKVLYIEGRVRPEYRELSRALARDAGIELATLLRLQEDRFAATGTVNGVPLETMPRTSEQWRQFDVIIIGDLDASFLPPAQQAHLEQAVSDGAGLLMIGGQSSLGPGGYGGTLLERVLPVNVGTRNAPQETTPFVPRLTPIGLAHPVMQGLEQWFAADNRPPHRQLAALRGNVVVSSAKSGAEVLLIHPDRPGPDGQPQIILALQRYGSGRSAVFTADTTYLWYLPLRGLGQDSPYNRFWGQIIRWLASAEVRLRDSGPGLDALLTKSTYDLGEPIRLRALVRDERGDVTRFAQVNVSLSQPGVEPRSLSLEPVEARTGLYSVQIDDLPEGSWSALLVASKEGRELGRQTVNFTVLSSSDEMLRLAANHRLLADIAEQTRGLHRPLTELPALIDDLIRLQGDDARTVQRTVPLANAIRTALALTGRYPDWPGYLDLPLQGLLALLVLCIEWILRRRWQLA